MLMKYKEASEMLCVAETTLRRWVSQRRVPHHKLGRSVRFESRELESWIHEQAVQVGGRTTLRSDSPDFSRSTRHGR
jgi:excisionase family DNA binding protein